MNKKEKLLLTQIINLCGDFSDIFLNQIKNISLDLNSINIKKYLYKVVKRVLFLKFLQQKISPKFRFPLVSEKYFSKNAVLNNENYHKNIFNRLLFDVLPVKTELRVKEVQTAHFALTPQISEEFFFKDEIDLALEKHDLYLVDDFFLEIFTIFEPFSFSIDEFLGDKNIITPHILGVLLEYISENADKKGSGSFYTPPDMALFMLQESYPLLKNMKTPKIVEPSVGGGAFLIPLIYFLKKEGYLNSYSEIKNFVCSNLTLIDIDSEAIYIAKMRLTLSLINYQEIIDHEHNRGVEPLLKFTFFYEKNVFDFKDELEFKCFFKDKFDFIIGNPPYIGEKGNKEIFQKAKSGYFKKYYQSKMDFYYFFFFYGLNILNDDGVISFITTNYYLTATSAKTLREMMFSNMVVEKMFDFQEVRVFKMAIGQHNLISILRKSHNPDYLATLVRYEQSGSKPNIKVATSIKNNQKKTKKRYKIEKNIYEIKQKELYVGDDYYIFFEKNIEDSIINKMSLFPKLSNFAHVNQGIVSGYDKAFIFDSEKIDFKNKESDIFIEKFYKNSDIFKYIVNEETTKRVLYIDKDINFEKYSEIGEYLLKFEKILKDRIKRYDETYPWYKIHRPRDRKIFQELKIVAPQRSAENRFAISKSDFFGSADIYYINLKKNAPFSIYYLLALLNSEPYYNWLYNRGKRKGKILELYSTPLLQVPIYIPTENEDNIISKITLEIIRKQNSLLKNISIDRDKVLKEIDSLQNTLNKIVLGLILK